MNHTSPPAYGPLIDDNGNVWPPCWKSAIFEDDAPRPKGRDGLAISRTQTAARDRASSLGKDWALSVKAPAARRQPTAEQRHVPFCFKNQDCVGARACAALKESGKPMTTASLRSLLDCTKEQLWNGVAAAMRAGIVVKLTGAEDVYLKLGPVALGASNADQKS